MQIFRAIGQVFIDTNVQMLKNNQAIWSHCIQLSLSLCKRYKYILVLLKVLFSISLLFLIFLGVLSLGLYPAYSIFTKQLVSKFDSISTFFVLLLVSLTRLGDFLHFGQLWQQLICPNLSHY